MLISEKHNFIFIHIYKNAGTSITRALLPFCTNPLRFYAHRALKKINIRLLDPFPYSKHISARKLVEEIGYNKFKSYFSFAVARNPWDWQVSLYHYMLQSPQHRSHEQIKNFDGFEEYIRWRCSGSNRLQKDFVCSKNGEQLVDFIASFENIEEDFKKICTKIGVKAKLPHLNSSNTISYKDFYTDETRDLVYKAFKKDIEFFGYEF